MGNVIKNETKNVNKSRFLNFCNIFHFLTSRTQKMVCWPSVFKADCHNFPIMNNPGKFKEIQSTSFYCIIFTSSTSILLHHSKFVNIEVSKSLVYRTKLGNKFLKEKARHVVLPYNKQRNLCLTNISVNLNQHILRA